MPSPEELAHLVLKLNEDEYGTTHNVICYCGHWIEEHYQNDYMMLPCNSCSGCDSFTFEPSENTVEAIANRGGDHEDSCNCTLCRVTKPHFKIARSVEIRHENRHRHSGQDR